MEESQARELRQVEEANAQDIHLIEEARKAQHAARDQLQEAYDREMERERRAVKREDRLFDRFQDCMEKTRSYLNETALLRDKAARLELELKHAPDAATTAAAAASAARAQLTELLRLRCLNTLHLFSEAVTDTLPTIIRKLAKKKRHYFASAIAESDIEQGSAATAADTTSHTAAGIAEAPLVELEPTVSVAPPTSAHAHVYEPVDVIDVDEPVWVLHTTEELATTSTQSTSYVAHSTVQPRTALSTSQSKGTVPAAHTTPQIQSQYLHPPQTQIVAADIHPPPASFVDTSLRTCTMYLLQLLLPTVHFPVIELLPPVPSRRETTAKTNTYCRHCYTSGFTLPCTLSSYACTCHLDCRLHHILILIQIYPQLLFYTCTLTYRYFQLLHIHRCTTT